MRARHWVAAALVVLLAGLSAASWAAPQDDFTVTSDRATVTLAPSGDAVFSVRVDPTGAPGPVAISVTGLPSGVTAQVSNSPVAGRGTAFVQLSAAAGATGHTTATVAGASGALRHAVSVHVGVTAPTPLTATLDSPAATVADGSSVDFALTLRRAAPVRRVTLAVSGLPANVTGRVSPQSTTGDTATVRIYAWRLAVPGVYRFDVTATATSGAAAARTSGYLTVTPRRLADFSVSGTPTGLLYPGAAVPIALTLTNPTSETLKAGDLTVVMTGTSRPACTLDNFALRQFSGRDPLAVPAHSTRTLTQLKVARAAWPAITLRNLPTNQDVCKNVTVTLEFAGTGHGNR